MIDLHVHILPGIDDGPTDLEESLAMARAAVSDGITALVATPHVISETYNNTKEKILKEVSFFNNKLTEENINLKVYPGAEYMLDPGLPKMLEEGQVMTINDAGKYILVELPMFVVPSYARQVLYELRLNGVTPILAHPERYPAFIQKPDLLQPFLEMGVLSQVTSGSLTGYFGYEAKKLGWHYLKRGMCHLICTDAHSPAKGSFSLSQTSEAIITTVGSENKEILTLSNPSRIIDGKEAANMQEYVSMANKKRKGFLSKFF